MTHLGILMHLVSRSRFDRLVLTTLPLIGAASTTVIAQRRGPLEMQTSKRLGIFLTLNGSPSKAGLANATAVFNVYRRPA